VTFDTVLEIWILPLNKVPRTTHQKASGLQKICASNIHHNQKGLSRRIWFSSQGETLKMSTRKISWVYRLPVRGADNLTTFKCWMSWKSGSLNLMEHSGPHWACYWTPLPL